MVKKTATGRPEQAATNEKWVYILPEGNAKRRDLLGGNGAGLSERGRCCWDGPVSSASSPTYSTSSGAIRRAWVVWLSMARNSV